MKKLILLFIILSSAWLTNAQEKGFYLTIGGGLAANNYRYTLDNDNTSMPQLGFSGNLGVQYFFTQHWGLATGVGISFYNSRGNYSNSWENDPAHYSFEGMYDDDFRHMGDGYENYTLLLEMNKWKETQQGYFLEVPLMLMYQTKWGTSQSWGMYFGIGAKAQIPVISQKFEVKNGSELSVMGYYKKPDMLLPDPNGPDLTTHGFGKNSETDFSGDMDVKTGFAASAKIGLLKTLSPRVDLTLGAYFDYGFTDIKDGNKTENGSLINPENGTKTIYPSTSVGDNMQYNGYINSHAVDKAYLMALGGEIGLRIKLGKLTAKEAPKDSVIKETPKPEKYLYNIWVLDSLTRKPMQTEVAIVCQNCPNPDNQSFYSSQKDTVTKELYPANTYKASTTRAGFPVYNTQFTTVPGQKDIIIVMPLHPSIAGTIKSTKNVLLPDVNVQVNTLTGKKYTASSNKEGYFIIPSVDAGTHYTVVASKTGYVSDTVNFDIPSDPEKLQPTYVVMKLDTVEMQLKPVSKIILSALVLFDLDKFNLRPEAKKEIDVILPMLKENPYIQISVDGHTDSRGSAEYNKTLSEKRANSVRDYMVEQGIDAARIKAHGYGYTNLLNKCKPRVKCTEEEHQQNRRVEFIFKEK